MLRINRIYNQENLTNNYQQNYTARNARNMLVESDGKVLNGEDRPSSPSNRKAVREIFRLSTFEPYSGRCDEMQLCNAGFYYIPERNQLKCYSCGNRVEDMQPSDDFYSTVYHRDTCPHNYENRAGNISVEDSESIIKKQHLIPRRRPDEHHPGIGASTSNQNHNIPGTSNRPVTGTVFTTPMLSLQNGANNIQVGNRNPPSAYPQENKRQRRQYQVKLAPNSVFDQNHEIRLNQLDLSQEADRRKTFETQNWIFAHNLQLTHEIAKEGFFYLGNADRTQCFSCNVVLKDWRDDDNPVKIHAITSRNCKMVLRREKWNLPIGRDIPATNPSISPESSIGEPPSNHSITIPRGNNEPVNPQVIPRGGLFFQNQSSLFGEEPNFSQQSTGNLLDNPLEISNSHSVPARNRQPLQPMESSGNLPISTGGEALQPGVQRISMQTESNQPRPPNPTLQSAQHVQASPASRIQQQISQPEDLYPLSNPQAPAMGDIRERRQTFTNSPNWPHGPELTCEVVETGFYSLGYSDKVRCWYCGVEAENFQHGSRPWEIHVRNYPSCNFVLSKRGLDFVEAVLSSISGEHESPTQYQPEESLPSLRSNPGTEYEPNSLSEEVESGPTQLPPPIVLDPDEELARNREELLSCMQSDMVAQAITMGFSRSQIKAALKQQIRNHSCGYQSLEALLDGLIHFQPDGNNMGDSDEESLTGNLPNSPPPVTQPATSSTQQPNLNVPEASFRETEQELRRLRDEKRCKVCLDGDAEMVFVPCGHLCCCLACTRSLRQCPICRTRISKAYRTYSSM